ncbi:hypothetical protein LX36DRAFT_697887 [Colletotrichum falcatum]|nr:hypothetical protein LX36DRAFT_697887 [Colletotrichum falcatum]
MDIHALGRRSAPNKVVRPSDQGQSAYQPELETLLTTFEGASKRTPQAKRASRDILQTGPRVVSCGGGLLSSLEKPTLDSSRQPASEPNSHHVTFLGLPYELRLDIYELLLLAPDPIVVSNRRRQLYVKVEPPEHRVAYLRAPRPRPRVVMLTYRTPYVEILRACKQINHEATPILYRKNKFIAGLKLTRKTEPRAELTDLAGFFLYSLRPSTLLQLSAISFRGACHCNQWLHLSTGAGYTTSGNELGGTCPGGWDYLSRACLVISNALWSFEKDSGKLRSHWLRGR